MSRYSSETLSSRRNQKQQYNSLRHYNYDALQTLENDSSSGRKHSNDGRNSHLDAIQYNNSISANNLANKRNHIRYSSYHDFRRKGVQSQPRQPHVRGHCDTGTCPRSSVRNSSARRIFSERHHGIDRKIETEKPSRETPSSLTAFTSDFDRNHHTFAFSPQVGINQERHPVQSSLVAEPLPNLIKDFSQSNSSILSISISGCGGHCLIFQNFCHYFLQVIFVMGILTGISLCLAGSVLRHTKTRDLQVLVYIGSLSSIVCTVLLVIQCRVRSQVRQRKKNIQDANVNSAGDILNAASDNSRVSHNNNLIPLTQIHNHQLTHFVADDKWNFV